MDALYNSSAGLGMTPADLKSARKALGYTVTGMAEKLHMNRRSIQRMESGEMPILPRTALAIEGMMKEAPPCG